MKDRLLDVKTRYFDQDMATAQLIPSQRNSILSILDEALVNGGPSIKVSMITTVEDPEDNRYWLATITTATAHKYKANLSVVSMTGASEAVYNSTFRVQEILSNNSFTIAFDKSKVQAKPNNILDASNTNVKMPSLGYIKPYSAEGKAAYISADTDMNTCYLRVDCNPVERATEARFARVSMYSDMRHIDDYKPRVGRQKAPYNPEIPDQAEEGRVGSAPADTFSGISKWYYNASPNNTYSYETSADSTPTTPMMYTIIGDDKTFYFFLQIQDTTMSPYMFHYIFGQYKNTNDTSDKYNFILTANESPGPVNSAFSDNVWKLSLTHSHTAANSHTGRFIFNNELREENLNPSAKAMFYANNIDFTCRNTHVDFSQYNTKLNLIKVGLIGVYPIKQTLLGEMRGYYWIQNNLAGFPSKAKDLYNTVVDEVKENKTKKFYLQRVTDKWNSGTAEWTSYQHSVVGFELNDWD